MASLQLKLLGGLAASLPSGRPVELVGKKNQALLAYLAVNRGKRHSREKLMGLLWGDRGETQARGSNGESPDSESTDRFRVGTPHY